MGAPKGNRNAAGSHKKGHISKGAKRFISKVSGRTKFTRQFKKNWGKGSTRWEVNKNLRSSRSR